MATFIRNQQVLGVVPITDRAQKLFNNLPVIGGVDVSDRDFDRNQLVRPVEAAEEGRTIHNGLPVRGVFIVTDGATMHNGLPVVPMDGLGQFMDWPDSLFYGGKAGFYSGFFAPPAFDMDRLFSGGLAGFWSGYFDGVN